MKTEKKNLEKHYKGGEEMSIIEKIGSFIEKEERIYLQPGESPPKGIIIQRGKRGGYYYVNPKKIKPPKMTGKLEEKERKSKTLPEVEKGLTNVQSKVFENLLDSGEWKTAYDLGVRMNTMTILVQRGLVIRRGGGSGSIFSPETTFQFKSKFRKKMIL